MTGTTGNTVAGTVDEVDVADLDHDLDLDDELDLDLAQWLDDLSGGDDGDATSAVSEKAEAAAAAVKLLGSHQVDTAKQQQALLDIPKCHTTACAPALDSVAATTHHGHNSNESAAAAAAAFMASFMPPPTVDSSSSDMEATCLFSSVAGPALDCGIPSYAVAAHPSSMQAQPQVGGQAPPKTSHQQHSSSSSNAELGTLGPDVSPVAGWALPQSAPHQASFTNKGTATLALQVQPVHGEHLSGSSPELSTRSAASGFLNNGCIQHTPAGGLHLPARHQQDLQHLPRYATAPAAQPEAVVVSLAGESAGAVTGPGSRQASLTAHLVSSSMYTQGVDVAARQPDLQHDLMMSAPAMSSGASDGLRHTPGGPPGMWTSKESQGYASLSQQQHPPATLHHQGCPPSYLSPAAGVASAQAQAGLHAPPGSSSLTCGVYAGGCYPPVSTDIDIPAQHITAGAAWSHMHSSFARGVPLKLENLAGPGYDLSSAQNGFDPQWDPTLHKYRHPRHGDMQPVRLINTSAAAHHTAAAADGDVQQHSLAVKHEARLTAVEMPASFTGKRCSSEVQGDQTYQQHKPPSSAGLPHHHTACISPSPHIQQHGHSQANTTQAADIYPSSLPTDAATALPGFSGTTFALAAAGGVPDQGMVQANAAAEATGSVEGSDSVSKHCHQDITHKEINPLALYVHPLLAPLFEGLDPQDVMIPKSVKRSVGRPGKADRLLNYAGQDFAAQLRLERQQEPLQHHKRCRCGRARQVRPAKKQQKRASARPRQEVIAEREERLAKRHKLAVIACSATDLEAAAPPSAHYPVATARLLPPAASGGVPGHYVASPAHGDALPEAFYDTTSTHSPGVPAMLAVNSSIKSPTVPSVFTGTSSISSYTAPGPHIDHSSFGSSAAPAATFRTHQAQQVMAAPWHCSVAEPHNQPCLGLWPQPPSSWPTAAFQVTTSMTPAAPPFEATMAHPSVVATLSDAAVMSSAAAMSSTGSQFRDDKTFQALVKTGFFPTGTFRFQVGPSCFIPASVLPTGFIFWAASGQQYPSPSRFSLAVLQQLNPGCKSSNGWQDIKLSGVELGAWRDAFITKRPRPAISADCILQLLPA